MRKICIFLLVLFCGNVLRAQVNPAVQDTTKTQFSVGKVELDNPPSVLSAYKYDPVTDRYIYTNSVDGFSIDYPIVLTPREYEDLVLKESRRDYFRKKSDAIDGKKSGSEAAKKDLLPRYYINSSLFESVFGSNTIDVKPTGSVEMDLGIRYTKQDNPSFSPRNRSSLTFDFDQRISMSLMGKVGTRLEVNANYDTQSTFAFQNLFKLAYTPSEDDIIQKVEVGNVSMPLNSSLIRGAQSLFGVKTQLQFGKTTITGVFSEQKSQTKSIVAEGGGTVQNFDLYALDYDNDRHFFLSQYFRDKYDESLVGYPLIRSRVQITRIEVWVTNKQNRVNTTNNNLRNVIALQDLGEGRLTRVPENELVVVNPTTGFFNTTKPIDSPSDNTNNNYDPKTIGQAGSFLNQNIREIVTAKSGFNSTTVSEGTDYSVLENARKLTSNEYTYNSQLGYISLQQRLANDEILAVAYEYTVGNDVYRVGEFGSDGVDGTIVTGDNPSNQAIITQSLILKMLKSSLTNVNTPVWNLMMKNVYQIPQAYQIKQDDFRLNILYTDPSPINYISPVTGTLFPDDDPVNPKPENYYITKTPLLNVFNVDQLNYNNDPQRGGDGFFDYIPGITVDVQNGRIIFTTKEPFGELIFKKLKSNAIENYADPTTYNDNQKKYVFRNMYRTTQSGALQDSDKNKFLLRGKYKSSGSNGIPIGAFNVPQGSVVVTAAGRRLIEGIDYSVDYQLGRVQILDPSLQASNTPIEVSLENNSIFGQQTRRFMGFNIEHKISDNFVVGGTYLKMTERPFTQKSSYGQESVNNTIFGFNGNYSTEVPFLTRLVNKLPNIDTDVPSNLSIRGEIAFLKPDAPKASDFEGEPTIYIDDFEGSQSTIDMRSAYAWSLASTPFINAAGDPTFNANFDDLRYGYKRSKLSWYTIDPVFYSSKPSGISNDDLSLNTTRRVYSKELYPNTDIAQGQIQVINTLDLSYYPSERGPYNNNPSFNTDPVTSNFGGIMRSLNSTNFEQGNVEYIQFWVLDPYVGNGEAQPNNTGKIYFNLGEVSEDVLKDGRKQYENGLGPDQVMVNPQPLWGDVPASQSLIYAFDTNADNRRNQDVGLDGLPNSREGSVYNSYAGEADPAADDYTYYLNTEGGVLERYKKYNGVEGNSAVSIDDPNRGSTTLPDVEDINRDNTMNTINAYYEYSIDLKPGMAIGQNYITDIRDVPSVELPNGMTTTARWIQFKIPVSQPQNTIGNISDFRSIRFMRMFMTGFNDQMTVRFGALDLVRGEWRRYTGTLDANDTNPNDDGTEFDVSAVNIQENGTKCPVNYVIPPGVQREQLYNNNTVINQNEQSLALRIGGTGLKYQDSRAVFKNVSVDMRQYKKLKMFLHAESLPSEVALEDDEMVGFIRFGNDFTQNYYQVEIPLKVTKTGGCLVNPDPSVVWMEDNDIDLALDLLTRMKIKAMPLDINSTKRDINGVYYPDDDVDVEGDPSSRDGNTRLKLGIKGNPNFGLVRNLMVGVKSRADHKDIKGEVWFNELRMADLENKGGMAAILNIDTNMADFATVSASGKKSTIGFGSLEQGANERDREDIQQYNIVTNLNLGKLLPKKWGINLPFNYAIGEEVITPEYDPFNQDIKLDQLLRETTDQAEKDNIRTRAIDYTKRKSINFIGIRKDRAPEQKQHVYDVENLTFSQSYNQVERHDYEVESYEDEQSNTAVNYAYTFQPKEVVPFKQTKFMKKSEYWKLLSDFNFNYLPSNITFNTNILRQSNRQQYREVEVEGIGLDPLYRRNFAFNYQYGFGYNLTKSLKLNYTAASNNIVRNFLNDDNSPKEDFTIWDDYLDIGTPNQHIQQLVLNYDIPINKIPVLSFVKASYSYTADYSWQRSSTAFSEFVEDDVTYDLGNTIQNANSNTLTTTFNMNMLYKYLGLTPGGKKPAKPKAVAPPKPGEKIVNTAVKPVANNSPFLDGLIGVLTSVKNIQVNYTKNSGTVLPGYTPSVGFLGTSKPTLGFVFGSQDDVRYEAAKNGWLTDYQEFNQSFTQVTNKLLKVTTNIDLFPDFKIDLTMDRSYSENSSEQYTVIDGQYTPQSPYTYGMFSISTVLIKTAFSTSNETQSAAFDDFRNNRLIIANRLAESYYGSQDAIPRYGDAANPIPGPPADPTNDTEKNKRDIYTSNAGYPIGFGKSNQAVLLPAFISAYSGSDASGASTGIFKSFPIPNWSIKYNGLMRYKFFKDKFKRFSLQHNYRASYTINQFRSNFDYDKAISNPDTSPIQDPITYNYYNKTIMSNVNLVEQFSPLIRVDFELKSSLRLLTEIKKDRALSMSFDNNLLTEVKGIEYVVGLGYRFKDVIFSSRLADTPTGIIKSDINIKADFSMRNNETLVRYLDYDNNQLAAGQNIWSVKLTADYSFSKNLTAIFYYDHSFSKAVISTSFPLTNIRSGFTLRYNFGN